MQRTILALILTLATSVAFSAETLCTRFIPAANKQFWDTYYLNLLTVTRSNNKISGTFQHQFDGGRVSSAQITGSCTVNQLSFYWRQAKFNGQFSAALSCQNMVNQGVTYAVYNLVNIIAVIDGVSVFMNAMSSEPTPGSCP